LIFSLAVRGTLGLRNFRGKRDSFQETFPDKDDVDLMAALIWVGLTGNAGVPPASLKGILPFTGIGKMAIDCRFYFLVLL
jgi:hypothetical protein